MNSELHPSDEPFEPGDPSPPATAPVPAPLTCSPPGWLRFLYNHNPFYLISTFLVLYGIRLGYGDVPIGQMNCWLMMVTLTAYTVLAAATAVLIVKLGNVWDDARSLMLSLCILFVAISVSADELVMLAPNSALGLMLYGFFLSAGISQAVISGTGMRLPWGYLLPFYGMLFLLDTYAYVCSPEVRDLTTQQLNWRVFLFPQLFALLLATLWPAVRLGAAHVAHNGTPWKWPLYPGALFFILFLMTAFRAYILSLSFGPHRDSNYSVVFDAYFLLPMLLVAAFLMLEGGLANSRSVVPGWVLFLLPITLILAHPFGSSLECRKFYANVSDQFGSPLWLTAWALLAMYVWGTFRNVSGAYFGVICCVGLLSVLRPDSSTLRELESASAIGVGVIAVLVLIPALRWANSELMFLSLCTAGAATYQACVQLDHPEWASTATFHVILLGTLAIAVLRSDDFAQALRLVGAVLLWYGGLSTLAQAEGFSGSTAAGLAYFAGVTLVATVLWRWTRSPFFLSVLCFNVLCLFAGACWWVYAVGVSQVGRGVMFSICWAFASFTTALLISLMKAGKLRWLSRKTEQLCLHVKRWLTMSEETVAQSASNPQS